MPEVKITGLTQVEKPRPNKTGSSIIAFFDCEVSGFKLMGCALVRTRNNGMVAWPPRIDGNDNWKRCIIIRDDATRHAMMLAARETYRLMGGKDAEWIGSSIPMGPRNCNQENELDEALVDDDAGLNRWIGD